MPGEVHGVFMAINLHAFGHAIVMIGVIGIAARITGPHIPFGLPLGDPFGQHFSGAAALRDAKGKDAGLKRIGHAGHRANKRHSVGRIGDRAVDDFADPAGAQQRHPRHGVLDIPFKPLKIVWIKLKAKVFGQRIRGVGPMGFAVPLIGAKVEPVLFLTQIIAAVHIAQQRQFMALLGAPGFKLGNFIGEHILVAHHHHRHRAPAIGFEPLANALGVIARGIDHIFTADIAFVGLDDPFAVLARHPSCGRKAQYFCPQITRTLGQCLGQLRRINIAIIGIIKRALQIMGFNERIAVFDLVHRKDIKVHSLIAAHAFGAFKFLHPLFGMGQPDRAGDMIIHRIIHRCAKPAVQLG